jgi:hypothetical protein
MSHIVLLTPDGIQLAKIERAVEWQFVRTANDLGWFTVRLGTIDPRLLSVDNLLEFYRTPIGSAPVLMGVGFLRAWQYAEDDTGSVSVVLNGPDQMDLLARRIVAYTDPESTWNKGPDYADDLIKDVVSENMGPTSTDPWYNRGRAYPASHFSIAPKQSLGRSDTQLTFQFRDVLAVLQDAAAYSGWPSSDSAFTGLPVWFDLDYIGAAKFLFRTWVPIRGIDRTLGTAIAPLVFSRQAGNLSAPALRFDYTTEKNIVYGLGPGIGENRMVDPENDVPRENLSIWNLREGICPATEETTLQGVANRAYSKMQELRPRVVFEGQLIDTPKTRFGIDWGYGDIVTVRFQEMEFDGRIDTFDFRMSKDGEESVTAAVTITKALEGKPD